jgi:two-component system, NarL family, response regulator NreC
VLEGFLGLSSQDQVEHRTDVALGPREIEITRLVAEGKSSKEIALQLGIAARTVETHRFNIMHKLNLHSVAELIHYALRRGITTTNKDSER